MSLGYQTVICHVIAITAFEACKKHFYALSAEKIPSVARPKRKGICLFENDVKVTFWFDSSPNQELTREGSPRKALYAKYAYVNTND